MRLKKIISGLGFFVLLFAHAYGQVPGWHWALETGGTPSALGYSVNIDAKGDFYVTGGFNASILILGGDTVLNLLDPDSAIAFIAKYDSASDVIWLRGMGESGNTAGQSIITDAQGNIYVTGYFTGSTLIFGKDTLTNTGIGNVFVAKFDSSGNVLWANCPEGTDGNVGHSISVDANGNVYLAGDFNGPMVIFGNDTLINNTSSFFIVKYNSDGEVVWVRSAGGSGNPFANGVSADADGNVYMVGGFFSPYITLGNDTFFNTNGGSNVLVIKYDATGAIAWVRTSEGTGHAYGTGIKVDANDNAYVTGGFVGTTIEFGSDTLFNTENTNVFLVKYDRSGNAIWAKCSQGTGNSYGNGLSMDVNDNIYVAGSYSGTINFDSITTASQNTYGNTFVTKYNSMGAPIWAKGAGGLGSASSYGIGADAVGNVIITGEFDSTIYFGTDTLTGHAGEVNLFIAKIGDCTFPVSPVNTTDSVAQQINAGDSTTLTANGAGTLTWYSADTGGTYLGTGHTYVTPALMDTTTYYVQDSGLCGSSARTAITVMVNCSIPASPTNTSNPASQNIRSGNSATLTASGTGTISWYSSDTGGVYLGTGRSFVTPLLTDTTIFYVQDSGACGASQRTPITVAVSSPQGIANMNSGSDIFLYPNPTTGNIYFSGLKTGDVINIYDALGQSVYPQIGGPQLGKVYIANLAGLAKGVYLYKVVDNNGQVSEGEIILQ